VIKDEQRGVRLGFNEPQGGQIGSKLTVPSLGCLVEPAHGLALVTDQVRVSRVGKAYGLAVEDCLRVSVVEEGQLWWCHVSPRFHHPPLSAGQLRGRHVSPRLCLPPPGSGQLGGRRVSLPLRLRVVSHL
jgi:hypothetical protein